MGTTPSYKGLSPASEASSRAKRSNRHSDTRPETTLRRALWRMGLRYRKNVASLPGKPDVVFAGSKVAVFCDGDFWHGRNWPDLSRKLALGSNPGYWQAKIGTNIERDARHTEALKHLGWVVLRFWESDIKADVGAVASHIATVVAERKASGTRRRRCDHFADNNAGIH